VRFRLGVAERDRRQEAGGREDRQPGKPADGRPHPGADHRRVGTRLLPEVPEPPRRVHRNLLQPDQLEGSRAPLRGSRGLKGDGRPRGRGLRPGPPAGGHGRGRTETSGLAVSGGGASAAAPPISRSVVITPSTSGAVSAAAGARSTVCWATSAKLRTW